MASTPNTSQTTSGASHQGGVQKPARILSCVLCQHRRIKCDKKSPCSNCIKSKVQCIPSTPAPARKRRRPNQDLQERLARLEALLRQHTQAAGPPTTPGVPSEATPSADTAASSPATRGRTRTNSSLAADSALSVSASVTASPASSLYHVAHTPSTCSEDPYGGGSPLPAGKITIEDGSTNFSDSYFWGIIHDNLQEMREILDKESSEEHSPYRSECSTPRDSVDHLASGFSNVSLDDAAPSPGQVLGLWQTFLTRVNPFTKIVHVPTLQPAVFEAGSPHHGRSVPSSQQALLFAIYLVAVVSLTTAETKQMLGMAKEEAISRFTAGMKASLVKVNFLQHCDLTTLQALALYLISLQGRYNRHAAWVLSGVVIRIARKMGIHRDGTKLHLPPFETEMRRRVWWQIYMLDAKYAMTAGFDDPLLPLTWDTQVPLNVDDADFGPGSTSIESRDAPTEMAMCRMMYELGDFLRSHRFPKFSEVILVGQSAEPGSPAYLAGAEARESFLRTAEALQARLAACETLCHCDLASTSPVHRLGALLRPTLRDKVETLMTPMREMKEWGTEICSIPDFLFFMALLHHEQQITNYDEPCTSAFRWFFMSHFLAEIFLFLVGQLERRPLPLGSLADRAWVVVDRIYDVHEELWDLSVAQHARIACFVLRAWRVREAALAQQRLPYGSPRCVPLLRDALGLCASAAAATDGMTMDGLGMLVPDNAGNTGLLPELSMDFMHGIADVTGLEWDVWGDPNLLTDLNSAFGQTMYA